MARPGVTYLEVANAAQQLVAAGRSPTIETVRITLGTGSNSTLGSHLRTWKLQQDPSQQIATKENIPEELIAALKGVWERVMNQSDEKIQTIQQETQQQILSLSQEVQELTKENNNWQQHYQQTKQERDSLLHDKSTLEQLLATSKIEIAKSLEKLTGFEQQFKEKQTRIDELHRQNQQVQANLEHYRNASLEQRLADQQRFEQQQKQFEQMIQQLRQELTKERHDKTLLQQDHQRNLADNDSLKLQLTKLESQQEALMSRLTDTISELAKVTREQQYWQEQSQNLQTKYDEQHRVFADLKTQHATLQQQSDNIQKEINELRDHNKLLAHEKWELGQEKAQLYGQLKQLESAIKK